MFQEQRRRIVINRPPPPATVTGPTQEDSEEESDHLLMPLQVDVPAAEQQLILEHEHGELLVEEEVESHQEQPDQTVAATAAAQPATRRLEPLRVVVDVHLYHHGTFRPPPPTHNDHYRWDRRDRGTGGYRDHRR